MGCWWLVQWSSLGPVVLWGLKKVKALLIHLSLHADGLPACHPKPLNILLKSHVMQFYVIFKQRKDSAAQRVLCVSGIYCDGNQFAVAAKSCSCTQSLQSPLLFVLLEDQAIRGQKCNIIPGPVHSLLTAAFAFLLCFRFFFTASTSTRPPKSTRTSQRKRLRWGSICGVWDGIIRIYKNSRGNWLSSRLHTDLIFIL